MFICFSKAEEKTHTPREPPGWCGGCARSNRDVWERWSYEKLWHWQYHWREICWTLIIVSTKLLICTNQGEDVTSSATHAPFETAGCNSNSPSVTGSGKRGAYSFHLWAMWHLLSSSANVWIVFFYPQFSLSLTTISLCYTREIQSSCLLVNCRFKDFENPNPKNVLIFHQWTV